MAGNLLQQTYNLVDTWVVGHFLGSSALASVGSAYTLMTFLTSILIGLCIGTSAYVSILYGKKDMPGIHKSVFMSFTLLSLFSLFLTGIVYTGIQPILSFLSVPSEVRPLMQQYLLVIFLGIPATFLYNYFSNLLRAIGNSVTPLWFLAISSILNVFLDILFVVYIPSGVKGAAFATIVSQYVSGIGITLFTIFKEGRILPERKECIFDRTALGKITNLSVMTSLQQSIMNFGILMVQGLVNSFGTQVMAAFAAGVKIDSFAYMPVQDFGNAFSTFVAQNYGADQKQRIQKGIRSALITSVSFCLLVSLGIFGFAKPLMLLFIHPEETEILSIGIHYLHIEGSFYFGIGILFLLYGYYRAVNLPSMSLLLTVISLGTRVLLAYVLSAKIGVTGIWMSVPIGWILADATGIFYYLKRKKDHVA